MVQWLVVTGLSLLVVSFALYVSGVLRSPVPVSELPDLWHLNSTEFTAAVGAGEGWTWLRSIGQGQSLALASLVFFPAATILVVFTASLLYLRRRNHWYAVIAGLEAAILVLAATGLFAAH